MSGKPETVRDLELADFVEQVLESDAELKKNVQVHGVDAAAIITAEKKAEFDKYGILTGLSLGRALLKDAVLEAQAEDVKGLVVGHRDRFGSKAPMRLPILSSTGNHIEASYWGIAVKKGDSKVELQFPAVISGKVLRGDYKGRDKFTLVALDAYETIPPEKAIVMLSKIAREPADLTSADEGKVVVLRAPIYFVEPMPIFKDNERVGESEIFLENSRDVPQKHPVLQMSLNTGDQTKRVRVSFERQKYALPTIYVSDMMELVQDASSRYSSPKEQAKFVGVGLNQREVIVVGYVSKYRMYNDTDYFEVGGSAIFDIPGTTFPTTLDRFKEEKPAEAPPAKEPSKPAEKPAPAAEKPAPAEKKSSKKKTDALDALSGMKVTDADTLKIWVTNYCLLTKAKPEALTAAFVKQLVAQDLPESVIESVLEEMRG